MKNSPKVKNAFVSLALGGLILTCVTGSTGQHDHLSWSNRQITLCPSSPVTFVTMRGICGPASGDNPQQAFASCAELQAFSE